MTYSIIGILASLVLIIINRDILWDRKDSDPAITRLKYRNFLIGVLIYHITDALWGIFADLNLISLLYIDTVIYFVVMAASVLLWTRYVMVYLDSGNAFDRILQNVGELFFAFEIIIIIINFFYPVMFRFDENGDYHAEFFRYVTLAVQILMFVATSVYTLSVTYRSEGIIRLRHLTIGWFGIAMTVMIAIQVFYPLLPFYSIGYMLGICLLHSFVVEGKKEEYRMELESSLEREKFQKHELAENKEALDRALTAAENASNAKTAFLNNMSHDIRTPMNAIVGFTELAALHIDDKEQVKDYLDKIRISSRHLLSLINDVLDMSRIESGKMTLTEAKISIKDLIRDINTIVQEDAKEKQLDLIFNTRGIVHEHLIADRLRLTQVLLNILSNAIKFTPKGGRVTLQATEISGGTPDMAMFEFRVRDNGIGMSDEFRETIFEAFSREQSSTVSRIQGTGLGMTITKNIVDMMNGTIEVNSTKGEGTEFIVNIPCRISGSHAVTKDTPKPEDAPGRGYHILLAEDNEMNRIIAREILTGSGFSVDIATDGDEAVEMVSKAPQGTYDAIMMDIQMPRMNGYDAAKQIRGLPDSGKAMIPIVAVTANAFEEDRDLAIEAGMNDHLAKPYDIPKILETLQRLINESKGDKNGKF